MSIRVIKKRMLAKKEASEYIGVCLRTFNMLEKRDKIKRTKISGVKKVLYDVFDLDDYLDSLKN